MITRTRLPVQSWNLTSSSRELTPGSTRGNKSAGVWPSQRRLKKGETLLHQVYPVKRKKISCGHLLLSEAGQGQAQTVENIVQKRLIPVWQQQGLWQHVDRPATHKRLAPFDLSLIFLCLKLPLGPQRCFKKLPRPVIPQTSSQAPKQPSSKQLQNRDQSGAVAWACAR